MAELVDARVSKTRKSNLVRVRFPPSAPHIHKMPRGEIKKGSGRGSFLRFALLLVAGTFLAYSPSFALNPTAKDMADPSTYNIRFIGANPGDKLGRFDSISTADIDGDGIMDFIVGAERADYNGRTDSGSLYYINGRLYSSITGTGNDVNLSDPSNYTMRFDGSTANGRFGYARAFIADVNHNGKPDIVTNGYYENPEGRTAAGSLYIILDSKIDDYSGSGNNLDMADPNSWSFRIIGAAAGNQVGQYSGMADLDNNGKNDLIIDSTQTGYNSRSYSGSVWIFFDSLLDQFIAGGDVGHTVDLADSSNFNIRYDGAKAGDLMGDMDINTGDFDSDGKLDLMAGCVTADRGGRSNSGAVYVISNNLINSHSGVGQTVDLNISSNYSAMFYGASNSKVAIPPAIIGDLDGDGKNDFVTAGPSASNNSRSGSGSIYIVLSSLIETYSTTGQSVDLSSDSNYNIRLDGAMATSDLGYHYVAFQDVNNDGILDLVSDAFAESNNGRQNSGSIYLFYGDMLRSYSGLGNKVDTLTNYSIRYDGADASMLFPGGDNERFVDMNNDGKLDMFSSGAYLYTVDSGLKDAGYVYLTYNYPHTISLTSNTIYTNGNSPFVITGDVSAQNSVTDIDAVQFSTESNQSSSNWSDCIPSDGRFDSKNESFSCSAEFGDASSPKTFYIRSSDTNESYTSQENYAQVSLVKDTDAPLGSFEINSGSKSTGSKNVSLSISGSDSTSSVSEMIISENSDFSGASWENFSTSKDYELSQGDGEKTIYMKLKDQAGNESDSISKKINLDEEKTVLTSGSTYVSSVEHKIFLDNNQWDSEEEVYAEGTDEPSHQKTEDNKTANDKGENTKTWVIIISSTAGIGLSGFALRLLALKKGWI